MEKYRLIKIAGLKGRRYLTESGRILRRLRGGELREIRKVYRNKGRGPLSVNLILENRSYHWFKVADLVAFTYFCTYKDHNITLEEYIKLKEHVKSFHVNGNPKDFKFTNIQFEWRKEEMSPYDILDDIEYKWWWEKLRSLDKDSWQGFNERIMKQLLRNLPVLANFTTRKKFFGKLFDVDQVIIDRYIAMHNHSKNSNS